MPIHLASQCNTLATLPVSAVLMLSLMYLSCPSCLKATMAESNTGRKETYPHAVLPTGQGCFLEAQGVCAQSASAFEHLVLQVTRAKIMMHVCHAGTHAAAGTPGARGSVHSSNLASRPQVRAAEVASAVRGDVQDCFCATPSAWLWLAGAFKAPAGQAPPNASSHLHVCRLLPWLCWSCSSALPR